MRSISTRGPRVATLPSRHAYLDAALPRNVARVAAGRPPGLGWAPDPLWDRQYLHTQASEIDVVHVHFGFDALEPAMLHDWVGQLRADGIPLVFTVHDLRNPHHDRPELHDAQLTVLVRAAAAVLTLTPGAADQIRRRWGRSATVVAHPAVFDGPAPDAATVPGVVGVHLKSLRRNLVDVERTVGAVADTVTAAGGTLRVGVHREVADRPEIVRLAARLGSVLRVHDYLDDEALRRELTGLHVSVMVNRFGTHSGWLEGAHDVGTAVVAPDCGFYREQWPAVQLYRNNERDGLDVGSLRSAVRAALAAPAPAPADPVRRAAAQDAIRRAHAEVYRAVLDRVVAA